MTAFQEWTALAVFSGSPAEQYERAVARPTTMPLSFDGAGRVVQDCGALVFSLEIMLRDLQDRQVLIKSCLDRADAATSAAPTLAFAWTGGAALAGEASDAERYRRELTQSYSVAPSEQWLAEMRVGIIEQNPTLADGGTRDIENHDLALLVVSPHGIKSIAQRYALQPDFRKRVVAVVEGLGQVDQKRFLDEVKRAASEYGYAL
jgi:hypothetical protein